MDRFAQLVAQALNQVLETPIAVADLETPPDPSLRDLTFPTFKLAKQFRKSPPQVAQQLLADLQAKKVVPQGVTATAQGPYVNFMTDAKAVQGALLSDILKGEGLGRYGALPSNTRGSWVLE